MAHSPLTILRRGFTQVRRHGLRLLHYRYLVRPRILKRKPLACPPESEIEVHMQVCARDWINGHWTIRSFAQQTGVPFRLVLLHDGSLDPGARQSYQNAFPGVLIPGREQIRDRVEGLFGSKAPTLLGMWRSGRYFTLPKVIDSAVLATNKRILHIDPDVLFFKRPDELLDTLQADEPAALWNLPRDKGHADGMFCFQPDDIEQATGLRVPVPFGTGLGAWQPDLMPWSAAEALLSEHTPPEEFIFMLDQTLLALHAAANGWQPLPRDRYAIKPVESLAGVVARHYYGKTRDLMYVEGMPVAHRSEFDKKKR